MAGLEQFEFSFRLTVNNGGSRPLTTPALGEGSEALLNSLVLSMASSRRCVSWSQRLVGFAMCHPLGLGADRAASPDPG